MLLEILRFALDSFWHFVGSLLLIAATGNAIASVLTALFSGIAKALNAARKTPAYYIEEVSSE